MNKSAGKATFLSSLGAGLEYYDFIIYGMMAGYLSALFFPSSTPSVALIKAFCVFAVGYIARPFGGVLFGMIGDTFGRKKTFLAVMLLMAFATFCIGLLPTYQDIGIAAPCILVLLRLLQGLSFGAELPGAITVVCEYAEKQKQGTHSGFVISSVSLGSSLASFILYLLVNQAGPEAIGKWAWRIPFLLGGLLAFANFFIRKYLQETPEFSNLQLKRKQGSIKEPFLCLIRDYRKELFLGIGVTGSVASLVIFALYMPTYLNAYYSFPTADVYFAMTLGLLWSVIALPCSGLIVDRMGKSRVFVAVCLLFAFLAVPLFGLLKFGGLAVLIIFMMLYQTVIAFLMTSYFALLAETFPTPVRYTGIALCYNVAYSLMGCAPMAMTWAIELTGMPSLAIGLLIGFALLSARNAMILTKRRSQIGGGFTI